MNTLQRQLSQILLSKLGGNVDHTLRTVLCELIDNCLDNEADNIYINTYIDKTNNYLVIYDNGTGLENIDNIFLANNGKVNKKGCKNQGFLDSLAYLSNIKGELNIYTNYSDKFSRICIDFDAMHKEFQKQQKKSTIDYNKCQELLISNYTKFNDRHTRELLANNEILEKIKNGGTYITIPLHKDVELVDIKSINSKYFQYSYNQEFTLNFMGEHIDINNYDDICLSKDFKPTICHMYRAIHINSNELYKFSNNLNIHKYFKKTSKLISITKEEYEELLPNYKNNEHIASLKFSLISSTHAEEQMNIFNETSIECMRQLFISYQMKTLGPFKFPKDNKGLGPRNLLDVRIILDIHDDTLIKDIIMTNKSHTNMDGLNKSIIKFIEFCKTDFGIDYKSDIGKEFKKLKDEKPSIPRPGILNMTNYLKNELEKVELKKKQEEAEAQRKKLESEAQRKKLEAEALKNKSGDDEIENQSGDDEIENQSGDDEIENQSGEDTLKKKLLEANYKPWKFAVYFGILECDRHKGINAKDNYYRCHYGITKDDPKHRDTGGSLGPKWRRLFYTNVNEDGITPDSGKYKIEWELYQAMTDIEEDNGLIWETQEYFKCPINKFNIIYKQIRQTIDKYEGTWE